MKLVVTSSEDVASMNIRARLLEIPGWSDHGTLQGHPIMRNNDYAMIQVDRIHLDEDGIDERAEVAIGSDVDVVVFASRHKAASKIPTLTVHPIGNFSTADFGGAPGTLSRAHSAFMTSALRLLTVESKGMGFNVSFETTHHGPLLKKSPAFFIEIGSHEELWGREDAAEAVAKSIMSIRDDGYPTIVCVGGGHYAPRFTDVALSRKVSVGHMAANYALESLTDDMILQMAEKSGGAGRVYFHKKSMSKPKYRDLRDKFSSQGIQEISSGDLDPL